MDEASSSSSSTSGGRAIDRHNPIIRDSRRIPKSLPPFTISNPHPQIIPRPHKNHQKKRNQKIPLKKNDDEAKINDTIKLDDDDDDQKIKIDGLIITPPSSTRYLLSGNVFFDGVSDFDPTLKLFPVELSDSKVVKTEEESCDTKQASSSSCLDQVVVLRVSLHCRGCERKMRKHISTMEGVTSFNIDFTAKKVTVTGKVTPIGVLSSISKVKNAQLWPPTISSSSSSSIQQVHLSNSEFKNEYKGAGA
ncbi:hypothetical protein RD792_011894 [Penstemon davidsonii]|uniref:HMA domain-containing protein n=1 Tax=Penstemon davidsonii TaxID=160366 RepID=A0ABR0CWZ2_9LAMI|nr:hypothetical protein RD792_011894 [Penstemon davidsonii]